MAYKRVQAELLKLEEGEFVEGYLVTVKTVTFKATAEKEEGSVPKLVIFDPKTKKSSTIVTGAALVDSVPLLKIGAMTKLVKGKSITTATGNDMAGWEVYQDPTDMITV